MPDSSKSRPAFLEPFDLYLFGSGIRASQLVGILSVVAALVLLFINSKKEHKLMYVDIVNAEKTAPVSEEETTQ